MPTSLLMTLEAVEVVEELMASLYGIFAAVRHMRKREDGKKALTFGRSPTGHVPSFKLT